MAKEAEMRSWRNCILLKRREWNYLNGRFSEEDEWKLNRSDWCLRVMMCCCWIQTHFLGRFTLFYTSFRSENSTSYFYSWMEIWKTLNLSLISLKDGSGGVADTSWWDGYRQIDATNMSRSKGDPREAVSDGIAAGNLLLELRANYANLKTANMWGSAISKGRRLGYPQSSNNKLVHWEKSKDRKLKEDFEL